MMFGHFLNVERSRLLCLPLLALFYHSYFYHEPKQQYNHSLLLPYSQDLRRDMIRREKHMTRYSFNHSRTGVDRRENLSVEEFKDIYDGKWMREITIFAALSGVRFEEGKLSDAVGAAVPLYQAYNHITSASETSWSYIEDEAFITTRPELKHQIHSTMHLKEDLFELFPVEVRPWNSMLLLGSKFSRSSLHIDPYNWTGTNAVIFGKKRWKMFPPGQDHLLDVYDELRCGFPLDCLKFNSKLDSFDEASADKLKVTEMIEFDQEAGDLLIIPPGWFHQAFNTEMTLSISGQVMNENNYRIIIEEIFKGESIKRSDLPEDVDQGSPVEQVAAVVGAITDEAIDRGKRINERVFHQLKHAVAPND